MTLLTKGMGAVKKIMAKTAAGRKDQVLDTIRKSRNRRLPKKLQNKKIKIKGIGEVKSDQHIMDVDTYSAVSSAPDKEVKAWLKHKGFKE
tara:strand:- start:1415 stop:1684 length:270 start_codon:yes stop_codon:yes gene_type:complete